MIGAVESLLFVVGDNGISDDEIMSVLNINQEALNETLVFLKNKFNNNADSGIAIVTFANKHQMVTKSEYYETIKQYAIAPFATKLSQASMETLAIIAYKQPITRSDVDAIRGVQSSGSIQRLQLRNLIEAVGRENTPGKPILYGTTEYFLNYFGIQTVDELPPFESFESRQEQDDMDLFQTRYQDDGVYDNENNGNEGVSLEN